MNKYRKASEFLFKNNRAFNKNKYICNALWSLNISDQEFTDWFYDPNSDLFQKFLSFGWFGFPDDENQLARELALLFMEHIEKDEK